MNTSRLIQLQQDHNTQTATGWAVFAGHRRCVTQLLLPPLHETGHRLCVLGAGNCNDLDLAALTAAYSALHLVDLDDAALQRGVEKQQPLLADRIQMHYGVDISGIFQRLENWNPQSRPTELEVDRAVEAALIAPAPLNLKFTRAASVCLLSQLIHSLVLSLGEDHPRFVELMAAVRLRHLRLLGELVLPGGWAVLVTDIVSSDSCPAIKTASDAQLPAIVQRAIDQRNFFHGTNPAVIAQVLSSDPVLSGQIQSTEFIPPWRWNLGPREYAVYGIRWRLR